MVTQATQVKDHPLITAEEFEQMPEFYQGYELIEGKLVKKLSNTDLHDHIANKLKDLVAIYCYLKGLNGVGRVDASTRLSKRNTPKPDYSFWKDKNALALENAVNIVTPDMVVEVWSREDIETKNKRETAMGKIRSYQKSGIPLTLVIDSINQYALVFQAEAWEPYRVEMEEFLDADEVIPGFKVQLKELFQR
jgi:Uma2 family endonuclease